MSPAKIKKNKEMRFMIHWCAYCRQAEENKRVIDHSRDKLNTYIQWTRTHTHTHTHSHHNLHSVIAVEDYTVTFRSVACRRDTCTSCPRRWPWAERKRRDRAFRREWGPTLTDCTDTRCLRVSDFHCGSLFCGREGREEGIGDGLWSVCWLAYFTRLGLKSEQWALHNST